jgi:carboxyl-terminal processing protease
MMKMTVLIRALVVALIVLVAASAASLYFGYRRLQADAASHAALQVASAGSLDGILDDGQNGSQLVSLAVRQIDRVYYRPIDTQNMLDEERKALLAYLKIKHVANASIPVEHASSADGGDAAAAVQTLDYAQSHYGAALGTAGSSLLTQWALEGIATMPSDPYTAYLSPSAFRGLDESLSGGNFGGVGVYIYLLKDRRVLVQPISGLPAAKAGMTPGQIVTAVDGKTVKGVALDTVERMIRGKQGTTVRIRAYPYEHPKDAHTYAIVRQIIHVPTVSAKMEGSYDYIRLSDFGQTSPDEVRKAVLDGKAHHATGYILDLRDNGGGLVDAAVRISSMFVPSGKAIVSTIDRAGNRQEADALADWSIPNVGPLVILVNKYTASASEITAGALQDYGLAKIVGTKTFGKGVVQTIYPMPDSGALKITTARYVTPLGRDIQHRGISPDIAVAQNADTPALIDTSADKQLSAAKAYLARAR